MNKEQEKEWFNYFRFNEEMKVSVPTFLSNECKVYGATAFQQKAIEELEERKKHLEDIYDKSDYNVQRDMEPLFDELETNLELIKNLKP